jgi:hypothetical protein
VDLKPLLPPSSCHTLASEVALLLACIDMVEEEEARLFRSNNHGTHMLGAMEFNLPTIWKLKQLVPNTLALHSSKT